MAQGLKMRLGSRRGSGTLGTFAGVFTPSVLTILGIILFRRLGYIMGGVGLAQVLVIVVLANLISILTSVSLSAVATNFRVKAGGDYYLISRTLGVAFGGAIGIVLFLAQSVSIAFYTIGFGEVLAEMFGWGGDLAPRLMAAGAASLLFVFAWLGSDWASRFQFGVMAVLGAALVSFFVGGLRAWDPALLQANWTAAPEGSGFWLAFAIFFPAVTGFTQGVSMSGDLKNPGKSLPTGTFWAVGLSFVVYIAAALLLAGGLGRDALGGYDAMNRIAAGGWLVDAGVIAATLSSAMASFLGAPRILQALATDRVFKLARPFAAGAGPANNPRRGVLLSAAIAFAAIALGNLNLIAPVVAMFFLISYGLLNYATYYEARSASPAFRPRFRFFHARLSLLGALSCLGAMVAINPTAGLVSASLLAAIYQYLRRSAGPARWADGSRTFLFQRVREQLFAMTETPEHTRDWRPQILAFSRNEQRREQILHFAAWVEGGSGLTTAVEILEGEPRPNATEREEKEASLRRSIAAAGIKAFPLVIRAPDLRTGFDVLLQAYGVGPLRTNIVLFNWLEQLPETADARKERRYGRYLREAVRLGRNLVVLAADEDEWRDLLATPAVERRIDLWWGEDETGELMLMLAYLMTRHKDWAGARIRVLVPSRKKKQERAEIRMRKLLEEVRIEAEAVAVDSLSAEVLYETSGDAALVLLPLRFKGNQPLDPLGERPEATLQRLPSVAMVCAAEDIALAADPDEGEVAELATLRDEAEEAAAELAAAEKDLARCEKGCEEDRARVEKLEEQSDADEADELLAAREALAKEEKAAEQARRLVERAGVKAEAARRRMADAEGTVEGAPDEEEASAGRGDIEAAASDGAGPSADG